MESEYQIGQKVWFCVKRTYDPHQGASSGWAREMVVFESIIQSIRVDIDKAGQKNLLRFTEDKNHYYRGFEFNNMLEEFTESSNIFKNESEALNYKNAYDQEIVKSTLSYINSRLPLCGISDKTPWEKLPDGWRHEYLLNFTTPK